MSQSMVNLAFRAMPPWKHEKKDRAAAARAGIQIYPKQYRQAKRDAAPIWLGNVIVELVGIRMHMPHNYVTGRLVLAPNTGMHGAVVKCKARWCLCGAQDKQKLDPKADSQQTAPQLHSFPSDGCLGTH